MTETAYSSDEVCRLTGVSFRQLDHWANSDLISPSIRATSGSGDPRRWSLPDVQTIRVIKRLVDAGVSLERIRRDGDPRLTVLNLLIELSHPDLEEAS